MSVNAITTKINATNLQVVHSDTDYGTDGRGFVAVKNGSIYKAFVADDYSVGIQIDDGTVNYTPIINTTNLTGIDGVSICFNREADTIYAIYGSSLINVGLAVIDVATRTITSEVRVGEFAQEKVIKAIVSQNGRIVFLCGNKLYSMDSDGSNILSEETSGSVDTFILGANNIAYWLRDFTVTVVNIATMVTITSFTIDVSYNRFSVDGFVYNGFGYILYNHDFLNKVMILKFNTTTYAYEKFDLTTDYGVEHENVTKFYMAYDAVLDKNFGYLVEDNETDRQIKWQFDMVDNSLKSLRRVSISIDGGVTTFEGKYLPVADTSLPIQKWIETGSNGDEGGQNWQLITGGA